jgi:hypothetical protein
MTSGALDDMAVHEQIIEHEIGGTFLIRADSTRNTADEKNELRPHARKKAVNAIEISQRNPTERIADDFFASQLD